MDTLKHSASTGSHEVHICHRCNWPFPNPHPSSKHRRAHKRVCGTIKGYEIDQSHSAVSDDSDGNNYNEPHSPSPIVEQTHSDDSKGVVSIGGVGKYSRAKSEEDVFSDAITEFSDGGFSSPQIESKTIEGDFISDGNSQLKVVDDSVVDTDRTEQLNDPTRSDQTYESGAMVNAMDHFEGVALMTDTKVEPISVGRGNGLRPDIDELVKVKEENAKELVKAKEENATQTEEGGLDSSTLDCEEEKSLDPLSVAADRKDLVSEVVKHDSSGQTDTFEEKDATKEVKAEVCESIDCSSVVPSDSLTDKEGVNGSFDPKEDETFAGQTDTFEEKDATEEVKTEVSESIDCSSVVPSDSLTDKEGVNGSFRPKEDETFADKQVKTERVNGVNENGEEVTKVTHERLESTVQSDHSTDTTSDFYSNAEISEEGSKLESSSQELRDNGIEIHTKELESETLSDIQVKTDTKEVESVDIAGIESELKDNDDINELRTPEQKDSEIMTKIPENENKRANDGEMSVELNPEGNLAVLNANSKVIEESLLDDGLKKNLPGSEEHTDENFTFTPVLDKSIASPVNFQALHESLTACANNGENVSVDCQSLQDEGGNVNPSKENGGGSVMDHSTAESVSAVPETTATEDKSETNSQEPKTLTDKTDDFEPPSFMTLVNHASEIEAEQQTTQHPKTDALQAGWFPSLSNVVNESEGRKKNEEKIAKVTQCIPLKNLLIEAKSPNVKQIPSTYQKEEDAAKENGADVMKLNSSADVEAGKEMDKEWDSPARYPIESKKEKKKKKGFWMPFACCSSSVHQ